MGTNLDVTLSKMIISASGWRGVFTESGNEESSSPDISGDHKIIVTLAAKVFSDYLKTEAPGKNAVIVGRDTRPTGEAIADTVIRTLLAEGREVLYTGVSAAPEIMALARIACENSGKESAAGFIYISASHNPIGHNGIKFGLTDGGVLQAEETNKLISAFRLQMDTSDRTERALAILEGATEEKIRRVYTESKIWKDAALDAYRDFSSEVISGFKDRTKQENFFTVIRNGLKKYPLGIAADFNGSARTVSIDREFLTSIGAGFCGLNEKPGEIAHRIVPEGESLDICHSFLEELHRKDPSFILGYMPDCDGDRGNLVIWDEDEKHARSLEAQEVFALACMAELSSLVWTGDLQYDSRGKSTTKAAVAVNDPTSLRIDSIARAFDVSVFRAEVGEANVVGLARKLRESGYQVRILGEGAAGGTITHPSAVRDPIDTLGAILKLLTIREDKEKGQTGLFKIWCGLSNQAGIYREDFTLKDIIASLPAYVSTGAYTADALLQVKTVDHGLLKDKYQEVFLEEWEAKKETLEDQHGVSSWEAIAYNGISEKRGITRFSEAGRGGLKIEFFGKSEEKTTIACIWMRGSGTEPVFRVMADVAGGDTCFERKLIKWQREMVTEADKRANKT